MKVDFGTDFLDEAIVCKTESESDPGQFHYTMLLRGGGLECSCSGWRYRGECKHTKTFALNGKGKAVLHSWSSLSTNQVFVLTILARDTATTRDPVWWPLTYNQVRNVLRRLRAAGYVETTGFRRSAHVYSITKKGLEAIRAHQQAVAPLGGDPPVWL